MSGDDTRALVARLREMADWCRESVVYGKAAVCDAAASRLETLEGQVEGTKAWCRCGDRDHHGRDVRGLRERGRGRERPVRALLATVLESHRRPGAYGMDIRIPDIDAYTTLRARLESALEGGRRDRDRRATGRGAGGGGDR